MPSKRLVIATIILKCYKCCIVPLVTIRAMHEGVFKIDLKHAVICELRESKSFVVVFRCVHDSFFLPDTQSSDTFTRQVGQSLPNVTQRK